MRSFLYLIARLLGDLSALQNQTAGRRIRRRVVGKVIGRSVMRRIR